MKSDPDCVFCKMVKGEIKPAVVYEDKQTMAFLDIRPASKNGGHMLVIPKEHYKSIVDIPDDILTALAKTIKKLSKALLKFAPGLNILQNNEKVAGQYVMHAHFHLIPRFENDGLVVEKWLAHGYKEGEIDKIAAKIKSFL